MRTCLHDPEEYGDPCELCRVVKHPARKAMAEALYLEQYGETNEFYGERMDMCEEMVDHMISAAMRAGWTLCNPAVEDD